MNLLVEEGVMRQKHCKGDLKTLLGKEDEPFLRC